MSFSFPSLGAADFSSSVGASTSIPGLNTVGTSDGFSSILSAAVSSQQLAATQAAAQNAQSGVSTQNQLYKYLNSFVGRTVEIFEAGTDQYLVGRVKSVILKDNAYYFEFLDENLNSFPIKLAFEESDTLASKGDFTPNEGFVDFANQVNLNSESFLNSTVLQSDSVLNGGMQSNLGSLMNKIPSKPTSGTGIQVDYRTLDGEQASGEIQLIRNGLLYLNNGRPLEIRFERVEN